MGFSASLIVVAVSISVCSMAMVLDHSHSVATLVLLLKLNPVTGLNGRKVDICTTEQLQWLLSNNVMSEIV